MSRVQVESPSLPPDVEVQAMDFVSRSSTSRLSHAPVIEVDDESQPEVVSRYGRARPTLVLDNDEPPSNRRRTVSGTEGNPVVLLDDGQPEGSSGRSRTSSSGGAQSGSVFVHDFYSHRRRRSSISPRPRPIVVSDTTSNSQGSSNGAQTTPIVVSDTEEERDIPVGSGSSHRIRAHRRRGPGRSSASFQIFSPSPEPRQQLPDPPIIAGPMPFAILPPALTNNGPPHHRPRVGSPAPRNGPGIQLGGGLLTHTRSRHRRSPTFSLMGLGNLIRSVSASVGVSADVPAHAAPQNHGSMLERLFVNWHTHRAMPDWGAPAAAPDPWMRRDAALGIGPEYEPSMTHAGRAGPGWTFDFGTEDRSAGDEILVCALCLDPLLAHAEGMVDGGDEERRSRRVWGLRCGHVLDGKCVGALMRPDSDGAAQKAKAVGDLGMGKGKGKQKEVGEEQEVVDLVEPSNLSSTSLRAPTPPIIVDESPIAPTPPDNSIRSRLRSRNKSIPLPSSPQSPAVTRHRKRKRGAEDMVLVVEDRYEWRCPVVGCGRAHVSIKVGGIWKMDADDGAVGIFV